MKYTLILLSILLFNTLSLFSQISGSFEYDGITREYLLDLPSDYEALESLPLVLNFHGINTTNQQQRLYSNMTTVADTGNFIVCYPQGIDNAWNVGWNFGSTEDDVGFTNALIDTLAAHYKVNLDAVFSTGMSNGGFMSYKLACELNHRIKAIASVTGSMHSSQISACMPDNPIPVMQIHGTADNVVFYNGNPAVNIGIEDLLDNWVQWNDCVLDSDTIEVPNIAPFDGTTSERIEYNDCGGDSRVVFYKVFGGQHTWPGASIIWGITSQDFNASSEIWNFFKQHTNPLVLSSKDNLEETAMIVRPNPFQNFITIDAGAESIRNIRIINTSGQIISENPFNGESKIQLPMEQLVSGIYFIEVETRTGKEVLKMVK